MIKVVETEIEYTRISNETGKRTPFDLSIFYEMIDNLNKIEGATKFINARGFKDAWEPMDDTEELKNRTKLNYIGAKLRV